jgi:hypothetical protein
VDPEIARAIDQILGEERSFCDQADALLRLLTPENVSQVMARVPWLFRREFAAFAREAYAAPGPIIVIAGPPPPPQGIEAVRVWLQRDTTEQVAELKVAPPARPRVAKVVATYASRGGPLARPTAVGYGMR